MKNRIMILAAVVIGAATVAAVGSCLPDEPDVVVGSPATPPPATDPATPPGSEPGGLIDPASLAEALDTPCPVEDSQNCYWRADLFGNGQGTSFVNVEGHIFPLTDVLSGE